MIRFDPRSLGRMGLLGLMNLAGLAATIAGVALIAALLVYELSFDRALDADGSVYRIDTEVTPTGRSPIQLAATLPSSADAIRLAEPGWPVARIAREAGTREIRADERSLRQPVRFADASLTEVIDVEPAAGDVAAALARPGGAVLTEEAASLLFGTPEAALGRDFRIDGRTVTVEALIVDWPDNSSFARDGILVSSLNGLSELAPARLSARESDRIGTVSVYVSVPRETGDPQGRLSAILERHFETTGVARSRSPSVTPLAGASLQGADVQLRNQEQADPAILAVLAVLAAAVLFVAACNFASLATEDAAARARESAVRRAFGAKPMEVAASEAGRSVLMGGTAGLVGFAMAAALLGYFSGLVGREVSLAPWPLWLAACIGTGALVGAVAGAWPSVWLARAKPADSLSGRGGPLPGAARLRFVLVALQSVTAAGTAAVAFVVAAQLDHVTGADTLGFDPEGIAYMQLGDGTLTPTEAEAILDRARRTAGVEAAALSQATPTLGGNEVARLTHGGQEPLQVPLYGVGADFFRTLGVEPIAGRGFEARDVDRPSADRASAPGTPAPAATSAPPRMGAIDRSISQRLGFEEPSDAVGETLTSGFGRRPIQIVGVVPDMPMAGVRKPEHEPSVYVAETGDAAFILARAGSGEAAAAAIAEAAAPYRDGREARAERLDAALLRAFDDVSRLNGLVWTFFLLSLTASALGIAGLTASLGRSMSREAGIRKAFGATGDRVAALFARRVALPVLAGTAAGAPFAYAAAHEWLSRYPDRIELSPAPVALAFAVVLALATVSIAGKGWALSRLRPATVLRDE